MWQTKCTTSRKPETFLQVISLLLDLRVYMFIRLQTAFCKAIVCVEYVGL